MKKLFAWAAIIAGSILILVCAILLTAPFFVDMGKYKPMIEEKVSAETGRPFSINGDIDLSLFPLAGFSLSDLHIGNPKGFEETDFVSIKTFDVRVKLLPLLFKDVQITRFVVENPRVVLVTQKDGRTNWEMTADSPRPEKAAARKIEDTQSSDFSLKNLAVGEMAVTGGMVRIVDHAGQKSTELSEIKLKLGEIDLDRPVTLSFSALVAGLPVSLRGEVGPLGKPVGAGDVAVDLLINLLDEAKIAVKGKILHPVTGPAFSLNVRSDPFSPKKLIAALDKGNAIATADEEVLKKLAFSMAVNGDADSLSVSDGSIVLDDSTLTFNTKIKSFEKPDVAFDVTLDRMDVDRYLPPAAADGGAGGSEKTAPAGKETPDFTSLGSLVLNGTARAGAIKAGNVKMKNIAVTLTGNRGVIRANPVSLDLYDGQVTGNAVFNAAAKTPKTMVQLTGENIQANGLVTDLAGKDIIEGLLKARIDLQTAGTDPDEIKKGLNGTTNVVFEDGAIKGIDLTAMSRNVQTAFGMADSDGDAGSSQRTDFSELQLPFAFTNGVAATTSARLVSPALRVLVSGKAGLVDESLDFKIQPKFVGTIAGQGDAQERSGVIVPVLITGTFASPKFAPDVGGLIRQGIEGNLPLPGNLKDVFGGNKDKEGKTGSLEETTKGLLKSLPFGK